MQVQKQRLVGRERAAEQLLHPWLRPSGRRQTPSATPILQNCMRVLLLQLCQALGQLRNSPLCMPPRTARRQGPTPVSCRGGHFLLQWLRGETTTTPTDVDWHCGALVEASSCPLRQNVTPASGGPTQFVKSLKQSQFYSLPRQAQVKGKETSTQRCAQEQRRDREERRKTKRPSTTRCVQINTARPASNPDTLTLPFIYHLIIIHTRIHTLTHAHALFSLFPFLLLVPTSMVGIQPGV